MKNRLVTALAAAALIGGIGLAYGQTKTEKGDPPATTSYSIAPRAADRGMTQPTIGAPQDEPKGGVKVVGQAEPNESKPATTK